MDSIPLWIVFAICVIGGAYFAATESSFSAVNKIKVKALADDGNRRAKGVMYKRLRTSWVFLQWAGRSDFLRFSSI